MKFSNLRKRHAVAQGNGLMLEETVTSMHKNDKYPCIPFSTEKVAAQRVQPTASAPYSSLTPRIWITNLPVDYRRLPLPHITR